MLKHIVSIAIRTAFLSIFFTIFFMTATLVMVYRQNKKMSGRIYPTVHVDDVNFGGKNISELRSYYNAKNNELESVKLIISYRDTEYATFSAEVLDLHYNTDSVIDHAVSIGRSTNRTSRIYQQFRAFFNIDRFNFYSNISYSIDPIEEQINYLADKYNTPPEEALFEVDNNRVVAFKFEKNGLEIEKETAIDSISLALRDLKKSIPKDAIIIKVRDRTVYPKITLSSANNFGIVEKIGEGQSNYTGSIPGRVHNVLLASARMHGVLIPKDETFSFNNTIGDISASTGYQPAYVIKNGRTVLGDGGGVCQVSTTLFRAAINTGLPIIERHAHAYRVHYYENDSKPGFDATVFAPSVDLSFDNNTGAYILIQQEVDKPNNILRFVFYGKKDDRRVEVFDPKIWDARPAPASLYQDDPTLKRGTTKQVDWSAPGAKASFHYRVSKDNQIITDQTFISVFRPWQAVFLVGTLD